MAVNLGGVVAVAVVSLALGAPLAALLWWQDRRVTRPLSRLAVACLWGGVGAALWVAVGPSRGFPDASLPGAGLEAILGALTALAAVLTVGELDCPTDGLVVGLALGFGWAVVVVASGAGIPAAAGAMASAAPAAAAMETATIERRVRRLIWGLAAFLVWLWWTALVRATVAAVEGSAPRVAAAAALTAGILALTTAVVLLAEARILAGQLTEEVRLGTLPEWVAVSIPVFAARVRGRWRSSGDERAVLARQLTRLALRKWSLRNLGPEERRLPALELVRLRQRLRAELADPADGESDDALA